MQRYLGIAVDPEEFQFCIDHLVAQDETDALVKFRAMRPHHADHAIWTANDWRDIANRLEGERFDTIEAEMNEMIGDLFEEASASFDSHT